MCFCNKIRALLYLLMRLLNENSKNLKLFFFLQNIGDSIFFSVPETLHNIFYFVFKLCIYIF